MSLSRIVPRAALGALTLGAVVTLAAPLLTLGVAQAGEEKDETTITISTAKDKEATVLKLEPMKTGETKTVTSESGTPVTVTRTTDGYTVKVGEREIRVKTSFDGDGANVVLPGGKEVRVVTKHGGDDGDDGDVNVVVAGEGEKKVFVKKHAYAYRIGDEGEKPSAADLLKKAAPKSLEDLDRPTRDAVERVLQEMLDEGDVFAPCGLSMALNGKDGGDGERVRVMVIEKKGDDGAKK